MSGRPVTDTEIDQIRRLHAAGETLSSVAKKLSRPLSTISVVSKREGLSWNRAATAAAVQALQLDAAAIRETHRTQLLELITMGINRAKHAVDAKEFGEWSRGLTALAAMELRLAEYKDRDGGTEGIASILDFDRQARAQYDDNHPAADAVP